jgi:hypothetical protein
LEPEILLCFEFGFAERDVTMLVAKQSAALYREVGSRTVEHKPSCEAGLIIESAQDKEISWFNLR